MVASGQRGAGLIDVRKRFRGSVLRSSETAPKIEQQKPFRLLTSVLLRRRRGSRITGAASGGRRRQAEVWAGRSRAGQIARSSWIRKSGGFV